MSFSVDYLVADDVSDFHRAFALAELCKLSYRSASKISDFANSKGFSRVKIIDQARTQAFVAHHSNFAVVVVRGTDSLADWVANLKITPITHPLGGKVHRGFAAGLALGSKTISVEVDIAIARHSKVFFAGHSLGGAIAMLAAAEFPKNSVAGIYTFGAPRIGSQEFTYEFLRRFHETFKRFVHGRDIVPRIPPTLLHPGKPIRLANVHRAIESESTDSDVSLALTEIQFQQLQEHFQTLDDTAGVEGKILGTEDHSIDYYVTALRRRVSDIDRTQHETSASWARSLLARTRDPSFKYKPFQADTTKEFGIESSVDEELVEINALVEATSTSWTPPNGVKLKSKIGSIFALSGSPAAMASLALDPSVRNLSESREAGVEELAISLPFVKGDSVQRPPISERGENTIIGILDTGIDVKHRAFWTNQGKSRILAVWDQRDKSSGHTPKQLDALFQEDFGRLYTASEIEQLVSSGTPLPRVLRDPNGHGTHVASIAAGSDNDGLHPGVAPDAGIIVVVPDMRQEPNSRQSIGYSISHVAALSFLKAVASGGNILCTEKRPLVINVSLGMNAGAHDGSSLLERAFDEITMGGRESGIAVVKSAGNEGLNNGHAHFFAPIVDGITTMQWKSDQEIHSEEYLEFWYSSWLDLQFRILGPDGFMSNYVSSTSRRHLSSPMGYQVLIELNPDHIDNSESQLAITLTPIDRPLPSGAWKLEVTSLSRADDETDIHGWIERSGGLQFLPSDRFRTISIPGTAQSVICVSACGSSFPVRPVSKSSFGPDRKGRRIPHICAPGEAISAADSGTTAGVTSRSGTSMAAPHVSGAIALGFSRCVKSSRECFNAVQAMKALQKSAQNADGQHRPEFGFGPLDISEFIAKTDQIDGNT